MSRVVHWCLDNEDRFFLIVVGVLVVSTLLFGL